MGIFAMSLYYVRQKEKEIGIRKVNGATVSEIMMLLNLNFIRWIIIAFVIAVPIAYYMMQRWLENYPYRISLSWWVFGLTGLTVLLLSVISISIQSWKAASANPVDSLKSE
jgi:putative ABC transport system permease protein